MCGGVREERRESESGDHAINFDHHPHLVFVFLTLKCLDSSFVSRSSMTLWRRAGWIAGICIALYVSVTNLIANGHRVLLPGWLDGQKRPNIVFILSDDQDLHMDSLSYMPNLKRQITDQGTLYRRHYCTVALCCPSRASLLTGRAAHNTNVTDINPPYGALMYVHSIECLGYLLLVRRISQVCHSGLQRGLSPALASSSRVQHLLCREAAQWPNHLQL